MQDLEVGKEIKKTSFPLSNLSSQEKGELDKTPAFPLTPQRLKYEAEVEVIKTHLGGLEKIRKELGLNRRKMAELLMVDPSAWTRWTKSDKAPPHVYRALQWYMELKKKHPSWHPQNLFNTEATEAEVSLSDEMSLKIQEEKLGQVQENLQRQITYLKEEKDRLEESLINKLDQLEANSSADLEKELSIGMGWKFLVMVNLFAILIIALIQTGWL